MHNKIHHFEASHTREFNALTISEGNRIIVQRDLDSKAQQEVLEPKALLIRAKQFMSGVSNAKPLHRTDRARTVDTSLARNVNPKQERQLSQNLQGVMSYGPDTYGSHLSAGVEDVVMDFLSGGGRLVGAVGLVLEDLEEFYAERVALEDAISLSGLRLSEQANIDREVSIRLGYIEFDSPPAESEICEYLQLIESVSPDTVGLEPYI